MREHFVVTGRYLSARCRAGGDRKKRAPARPEDVQLAALHPVDVGGERLIGPRPHRVQNVAYDTPSMPAVSGLGRARRLIRYLKCLLCGVTGIRMPQAAPMRADSTPAASFTSLWAVAQS